MANELITDGDYVLIYLDSRRTYMIKIEAGKTFHTHKGYLKLDEIIGKEYGEPIKSSLGVTFTTLKPILTDYIMKSGRNTQIVYPKDAALIVMFSGIGPGSRIVESGTGTGALTTALAHYVGSTGKVYTYELRSEFQKNAAKNLQRSKLIDNVELKSGDITMGIEEQDLDAIILDLAVPWLVIPHAFKALKPSGVLVSFSPTIDQVVRTTEALRENGFVFIETVECMMRTMQVERGKTRPQTLMTGHTGYITHARKIIMPSIQDKTATDEQELAIEENLVEEIEKS
ncbi:MAG: tRNA (adenine-N1)-methyltransferase [Candidatus Bathyarchaeota archaeon]|nr:tRNA (adenine-N1)-methyltransferase [Candidatus Bathyarchaeota archaeon]MDD4324972.1 tRNA (adenine-N1)-methyltransferase [Candidatus Bathyarchaeota archaeon]MDI9577207.1 tRNA (adenine-N1)-methyltransferase [Thermoproteota archaeon]MDT8782000.1 tRNA (adenine-N1)-methyltransferase [Candidatus Bathyarchaeota archaeon]NLD66096.1 tRNA (adenine-N1)-methyltransferase [Thermoproteota archaeon]